jgi:hypothetical protein
MSPGHPSCKKGGKNTNYTCLAISQALQPSHGKKPGAAKSHRGKEFPQVEGDKGKEHFQILDQGFGFIRYLANVLVDEIKGPQIFPLSEEERRSIQPKTCSPGAQSGRRGKGQPADSGPP